jgi:hypothetical protein
MLSTPLASVHAVSMVASWRRLAELLAAALEVGSLRRFLSAAPLSLDEVEPSRSSCHLTVAAFDLPVGYAGVGL